MIIYHPKGDLYNCIFRLLSIINVLDKAPIDETRLKIYDFFVVFPHLVSETSFPRGSEYSGIKKYAKKLPLPYEDMPDKKRLFSELNDYQIQAIQILKAKEIFVEDGQVIRIGRNFSSRAVQSLLEDSFIESNYFLKNLFVSMNKISLMGEKGLKQRTGLMEYRYDVA